MTKTTSWTEDERREMAHDRETSELRALTAQAMAAAPLTIGDLEKVTTYGLPSDVFSRVVDEYKLDGDTLNVRRTIHAKAYAKAIECEIAVA